MVTQRLRALNGIPWRFVLIGFGVSILALVIMGIPTALVPTPFFTRMIPSNPLDYVFLIGTALLLGTYATLHLYGRQQARGEGVAAVGGTLGGVLSFGCPICNKFLVAAMGVSAVMTYVEPYRPFIGTLSVAAMGATVYLKAKAIRFCNACSVPQAFTGGDDTNRQQKG